MSILDYDTQTAILKAFQRLDSAIRGEPEPAFNKPGFVHYRIPGDACGGVTIHFNPLDNGTLCVTAAVCSVDDVYCKRTGRELSRRRQGVKGPFPKFWVENTRPRHELFLAFDAIARHAWRMTTNYERYEGIYMWEGLHRMRAGKPEVQIA